LTQLENRGWLNPQTKKVEILFTTYNAHQDVLSVTYIFFFWNRAGKFHKVVESKGLPLDPYKWWWVWIVDFCWVALVLKVLAEEVCEVFKHLKQLGFRRGMKLYLGISNILDWTCILFSLGICSAWIAYLSELDAIRSQLKQADPSLAGSFADEATRVDYFERVHDVANQAYRLRPYLAMYLLVGACRLFKVFHAQPRLALVTSTLSKAAIDIIHFGVVFAALFSVYAFMALIMFGQNVPDFAWPRKAFQSTFLVLVGEFERYDDLFEVNWTQAWIWTWTSKILLDFVMLNMLVALLLDVYTEVKGRTTDARTLWAQAYENWRRWRQLRRGERVHLHDILERLDPTTLDKMNFEGSDVSIYAADLMELVPNLGEPQARRILARAMELSDSSDGQHSNSLADTAKRIQHVEARAEGLHRSMKELMSLNSDIASLIVVTHEAARDHADRSIGQGQSRLENGPLTSDTIKEMKVVHGSLRSMESAMCLLRDKVVAIPGQVAEMLKPGASTVRPSS
jgi:hypothetical protein